MKKVIELNNIEIKDNRVIYDFSYTDNLSPYFNKNELFFIEYDLNHINSSFRTKYSISQVPLSILCIPFFCNILPIAWILDCTLKTKVPVDKNFYDSIEKIRNGYKERHSNIDFKGNFETDLLINTNTQRLGRNLSFFSGGLDSVHTLIRHCEEKPILLSIWGSDIFFNDELAWNQVVKNTRNISKTFATDYVLIKSNFRKFLIENEFKNYFQTNLVSWWFLFQHGIGISSHSAPLAFLFGSEYVYLASSTSIKDEIPIISGSHPVMEGRLKFCKTSLVHDGHEFSRQDKIQTVCDYKDQKFNLRVCFTSPSGNNCCSCEKCFRTIAGILASGNNPNDYGFNYNQEVLNNMKEYLTLGIKPGAISYWKDIQQAIKTEELSWLLDLNFSSK